MNLAVSVRDKYWTKRISSSIFNLSNEVKPEGQQPQRRRCLACCCNKAPRKKQKPKAVEDTASEDYRHQQSKLLDEEIEDFSGTPFVICGLDNTSRTRASAHVLCGSL
eukprot:s4722_g8.t1